MAFGIRILSDNKQNRLEVIRRNTFLMDYKSVRGAASEGVKEGVFSRIIRQNPSIPPQFLNT